MLEKSNLTSYLLYGLEEIALVVIGILIALQIDNVNEARKEEIVRQEYYHQILKDLEKDKTYLLSELDKVNGNLKLYDEYISHINDDSDPKEVLFLQTKLNPYFSYLVQQNIPRTVLTLDATFGSNCSQKK